MKYLSEEELKKLATHRLLNHYKAVRKYIKSLYMYYGRSFNTLDDKTYRSKVWAELKTRDDIPEKKRRKRTTRKKKIYLKTRGRGAFKDIPAFSKPQVPRRFYKSLGWTYV